MLIPILLGTLTGTLTGLIPGIHINLITTLLLPLALPLEPLSLTTFIIALAITHTFLDFIPSIYLGAPTEDTFLSILPGHSLLLQGSGHQAVKLTILGSTIAILSLTIVFPLFIFIIPKFYPFLQQMMGIFLIWTCIFLILTEKNSKIISSIIFILSGFLGLSTLNLNITQPLLPLLTGLFAIPILTQSISQKTTIPNQKIEKLSISKKDLIKPTLSTILISPICSLFPGLGSSQAAIIISQILKKISRQEFLILLGSINTLVMSTSFLTLILFQKSRTGAAFAIQQLQIPTLSNLPIIILTILISATMSIPLTILISRTIAKKISKIPYQFLSLTIIIFLTITTIIISGTIGLIILSISTLLGITCIKYQVRKSHLMGAILIPTIIFYLPF